MRPSPRAPKLVAVFHCVLSLFLVSNLHADELKLLNKTTVERKALTFAEGPATRFGNTVNGRTHQQTPITTYRGYQYATYFDADRRVCISRRKLPRGQWKTIQFKDHRFKTNDSHNSAVLGICDTDGTIHMAFDHHASTLNYRISVPGAAHKPDTVKWDDALFSKVMHTLGSVKTDKKVTYPRFFSAPNGNLMLYYRAVTSGNGHGMIEEYNGDRQDWSPGLGQFISRDIGTYTANGEKSDFRCPYLNSISFAGNRLHVSWIWRDRFKKTHPSNQHDLCYAYSDDYGRTWQNSNSEIIGRTGQSFIHLNSPGLVVAPIPTNTGLSNQNTHYAYPDGSIHIMMLQRDGGNRRSQYHHHWRTPDGVWNYQVLHFSGTRPKLVGDENRSLYLIYTAGKQFRAAHGKPNAKATEWSWSGIATPSSHTCYGDALLDVSLWQQAKVLSVYSQEAPRRTISTKRSNPIDGEPSALNVIDYRVPN